MKPFKNKVLTITFDNGKEFTAHENIAKALETDIYFAHPYASWERGTNENTNGLLRQYFPKKRRLNNLTEKELQFAEYQINHRPRKKLGYKTPFEVFFDTTERLTIALAT